MDISYDQIAADYAAHRNVHAAVLQRLIEFPPITSESHVLEVGCGTGNYIGAIESVANAKCFGLEPSVVMLEIARKKLTLVSWLQGSAQGMPYPMESFDFIFSVDVIHHVRDRQAFFNEAFRVLRPQGWFATVTDSEDIIRRRMPLSHYFPETVEVELQRYPKDSEIRELLSKQGFDEISEEVVEFPYSLSDSAAFERKAFSSLHLISENDFAGGLRRMKEDLKKGPIPCVLRYAIYWGHKPQPVSTASVNVNVKP
jgi:ubiquinone/menaquinone biosynthesis C-methylase UbiE